MFQHSLTCTNLHEHVPMGIYLQNDFPSARSGKKSTNIHHINPKNGPKSKKRNQIQRKRRKPKHPPLLLRFEEVPKGPITANLQSVATREHMAVFALSDAVLMLLSKSARTMKCTETRPRYQTLFRICLDFVQVLSRFQHPEHSAIIARWKKHHDRLRPKWQRLLLPTSLTPMSTQCAHSPQSTCAWSEAPARAVRQTRQPRTQQGRRTAKKAAGPERNLKSLLTNLSTQDKV